MRKALSIVITTIAFWVLPVQAQQSSFEPQDASDKTCGQLHSQCVQWCDDHGRDWSCKGPCQGNLNTRMRTGVFPRATAGSFIWKSLDFTIQTLSLPMLADPKPPTDATVNR